MSIRGRFRKIFGRKKRCEHDWGEYPVTFHRKGNGWHAVYICVHCGEERVEFTTRRRVRRQGAKRSSAWEAQRRERRSAFKGIFTTDDAIHTEAAVDRAFRKPLRKMRERTRAGD